MNSLITVAGVVSLFVLKLLRYWFADAINAAIARVVDVHSEYYRFEPVQKAVRSIKFEEAARPPIGHTHGTAATLRLVADNAITSILQATGLSEYVISPGRRDAKANRPGVRGYYFAKDLQHTSCWDKAPGCRFAYRMVDVDYYVDVPALMQRFRPIFMYTFAPYAPAGSLPDGVFSSSGDEVSVHIFGGGQYSHKLWNYESDHFVHHGWLRDTVYLCEQRALPNDPHHKLVALLPVRRYWNWFGLLSLPGARLEYRKFSYGAYNKMQFIRNEGQSVETMVAFSPIGVTTSCIVPEGLLYNIAMRARRSKDSIVASIEGTLRVYYKGDTTNFQWREWAKCGDPAVAASMLCDIIENHYGVITSVVKKQTILSPSTMSYTALLDGFINQEPKECIREIVGKDQAYTSLCTAPTRCAANDSACVAGRLENIRNPNKPVPQKYSVYAQEFVNLVIPEEKAGTGAPVSGDVVFEKQSRPTQRRILEKVKNWLWFLTSKTISSFQKAETYAKYVAPRNISTVPGPRKFRFSQFTYAIGSQFYQHAWYAFAKTPRDIEQRVHDVLRDAQSVIPTDFSKFDGTHSAWLGNCEKMLFKRYFSPEFHAELDELMDGNFNATGFTKHGIRYFTGDSRASGCADTSLNNTFDNALVAYIVLRVSGWSSQEAWQRLGIYGGDDGLTCHAEPRYYKLVSDALGLKVKLEVIPVDQPVPFLGRVFGGCWSSLDQMWSTCDVARQATKLHVTPESTKVPDWVVLLRKAMGYLVTDAKTPLIGAWSKAVVRHCERAGIDQGDYDLKHSEKLFERYDNDVQFTQRSESDQYEVAAAGLGTTAEVLRAEEARLLSLGPDAVIGDFFRKLVDVEPKVEVPVAAGPVVKLPDPPVPQPAVVEKSAVDAGPDAEPKRPAEPEAARVEQRAVAGEQLPPAVRRDSGAAHAEGKPGVAGKDVPDAAGKAQQQGGRQNVAVALERELIPRGTSGARHSSNPKGPNVRAAPARET